MANYIDKELFTKFVFWCECGDAGEVKKMTPEVLKNPHRTTIWEKGFTQAVNYNAPELMRYMVQVERKHKLCMQENPLVNQGIWYGLRFKKEDAVQTLLTLPEFGFKKQIESQNMAAAQELFLLALTHNCYRAAHTICELWQDTHTPRKLFQFGREPTFNYLSLKPQQVEFLIQEFQLTHDTPGINKYLQHVSPQKDSADIQCIHERLSANTEQQNLQESLASFPFSKTQIHKI